MNFISDPAWQFVAVIIASVAVVISIVIYSKQRNIKGLVYKVVSNTSVLSINEEVKGNIQVLYKGKPVDYALLTVLKIWNYGNAPIQPSDYILPITFDFGDGAEVLDAEVLDTEPNDLKKEVILDVAANKITLKPVLLNARDSIQFKVLVTKYYPIKASARVNGVRQILTPDELPNKKRRRALLNIAWRIAWPVSVIGFPIAFFTTITLTIILPVVNAIRSPVYVSNCFDKSPLDCYPSSIAPFISTVLVISVTCTILLAYIFAMGLGNYLGEKRYKKQNLRKDKETIVKTD